MINNPPIRINEIQARWPGGVGFIDRIVHFVDIGADAVLQGFGAIAGHSAPFFDRLGVVNIGGYLDAGKFQGEAKRTLAQPPAVDGVRFTDVDREELYLMVVFFV